MTERTFFSKCLQSFEDRTLKIGVLKLYTIKLKSRAGTKHEAHAAVLCAASGELKNMLVGPFVEANQVQQGQPVELAASMQWSLHSWNMFMVNSLR